MKPPLEDVEQAELARWLDSRGVLWTHCPNGGQRHKAVAAKLRAQGVKAGVPDVLIFDPPPGGSTRVGVALELKRQSPAYRKPSPEQEAWLDALMFRGWARIVAKGADDAKRQLRGLGY